MVQTLTAGPSRPIEQVVTGSGGGALSGKQKAKVRVRSAAVPIELLLATGERLQHAGDAAGAEQTYRRALEAYPHEERATQLLGAMLADRNDIDAAIDLFEAAVENVGPPRSRRTASTTTTPTCCGARPGCAPPRRCCARSS